MRLLLIISIFLFSCSAVRKIKSVEKIDSTSVVKVDSAKVVKLDSVIRKTSDSSFDKETVYEFEPSGNAEDEYRPFDWIDSFKNVNIFLKKITIKERGKLAKTETIALNKSDSAINKSVTKTDLSKVVKTKNVNKKKVSGFGLLMASAAILVFIFIITIVAKKIRDYKQKYKL